MTEKSKSLGCHTCAHCDIGGFCTQFVSLDERTFTNDGYWICSLYEARQVQKNYNEIDYSTEKEKNK